MGGLESRFICSVRGAIHSSPVYLCHDVHGCMPLLQHFVVTGWAQAKLTMANASPSLLFWTLRPSSSLAVGSAQCSPPLCYHAVASCRQQPVLHLVCIDSAEITQLA